VIATGNAIGVIYDSTSGELRKTTKEHAEKIEKYLNLCYANAVDEESLSTFEEYMDKTFGNSSLSIDPIVDLRETKVINKIELIVANSCNLRCKYCYAEHGSYGMHESIMTPERSVEYLSSLLIGKYEYIGNVMFFGGEPTLCIRTVQAVCDFFYEAYRKHLLFNIPVFTMVSNGTLIDEKIVDVIYKYSIHLTISLDGPKSINDKLRVDAVGQGTYDRIVKGIEMLREKGSQPDMIEATYTSIHGQGGLSRKELQNFLKKEFDCVVTVADCCENGNNDALYVPDYKEQTCDTVSVNGNADYIRKCLLKKNYSPLGCDVAYGSFLLDTNGCLYPCHFFENKKEYMIGYYDGKTFNFDNYNNVLEKFGKINKVNDQKCKKCWAKAACRYCPAQKLLENDEDKKNHDCNSTKEIIKTEILKCAEK